MKKALYVIVIMIPVSYTHLSGKEILRPLLCRRREVLQRMGLYAGSCDLHLSPLSVFSGGVLPVHIGKESGASGDVSQLGQGQRYRSGLLQPDPRPSAPAKRCV